MLRTLGSVAFRRGVSVHCRAALAARTAPHLHRLQLQRNFAKEYYKLRRKPKEEDPFQVLGVDAEGALYADVKKTFLQVALSHHPDTSAAETEEEEDEHREIFMAARKAFEKLAEGPDGIAILRTDQDKWKEDELDAWFRDETGFDMPYMDAATMREVAEMTESVGGGLDRDGGMWTLARMVTENVKKGSDAASILQLEAGEIRDRQIDGILRRRRRR